MHVHKSDVYIIVYSFTLLSTDMHVMKSLLRTVSVHMLYIYNALCHYCCGSLIYMHVLFQGVEVFEEKLNPLCMQWLVDNGELPQPTRHTYYITEHIISNSLLHGPL